MSITYDASAIVWTKGGPAYQSSLHTSASADIHAVQSWSERERDLARFRLRGDNWDGFDSPAPNQANLNRAVFFLRILQERNFANPPMRVALSPEGAVAFEWLDGDNFLRAEIEDSDEVEWMLAIPGETTRFRVDKLPVFQSRVGQAESVPAAVTKFRYAAAGYTG